MRKQRADPREQPSTSYHARTPRRDSQPFSRWIDQDDAAHGLWIARRKGANDEAAEGVPQEHDGPLAVDLLEHGGQFGHCAVEGPWSRRRIAPCEAGPVVGAHARERCDCRLHHRPTEGRAGDSGFEQHGRTAIAAADGVQAVPTNVDQASGRRKPPPVAPGANALVEHADREKQQDKDSEDRHDLDR